MKYLLPILLLLALPAAADTLNEKLEDAGKAVTQKFRQDQTVYHYATGTVSLDAAVPVGHCGGGLYIWFNPDFIGSNVDATYTLYSCPRATASAAYATECLPLNFDPDGGGADTNIMSDATDSLQLWNIRIKYFGATITAGTDTAQAMIWCIP